MFFLFHGRTKTRPVPGGRQIEDRCPECKTLATFHEVEVTTAAGVFFVDVTSGKDRAFRCGACGETFDLRDDDDDADAADAYVPPARATNETPLPAPRAPRDLLAVLEAEREDRIIAAAKRDLAVEDELQALKRKLGKA